MKKVAIFTGLDIRSFGGGEKYAIEMSNRLKKVDITFFSYRSGGEHRLSEAEVQKLTRSRIVYYNAIHVPVLVGRLPLTISALLAIHSLGEYDVIYNYDPSLSTNLMLLSFAWFHHKKYIFGMHDPDPLKESPVIGTPLRSAASGVYNLFRNIVVRMIPNVRIVNDTERASLSRIGYKGRVYSISDFINTSPSARDIKVNSKKFIVIFANRLSVLHKGVDLLCRVVEEVLEKNGNVYFRIAGAGGDGEPRVKALSEKYPRNVQVLGFLKERELVKEYINSSLVISTSRFESFGLSIAEAQSFGLPAVSFDNKGSRAVLKKAFQGKLIKELDITEFAGAILDYYNAWHSRRITLGLKRKISNEVIGRYSAEAVLPAVEKMFLE